MLKRLSGPGRLSQHPWIFKAFVYLVYLGADVLLLSFRYTDQSQRSARLCFVKLIGCVEDLTRGYFPTADSHENFIINTRHAYHQTWPAPDFHDISWRSNQPVLLSTLFIAVSLRDSPHQQSKHFSGSDGTRNGDRITYSLHDTIMMYRTLLHRASCVLPRGPRVCFAA